MAAEVKVTNDSADRSNYDIDVVFEAPNGDQLDSASVYVADLDSGQSATDQAVTFSDATPDFACRVSDVFRFSDE